jgi:hypothetical protein
MSILPAQCRAGKIDMGQAELARRAVVRRDVIADFENGSGVAIGNFLRRLSGFPPAK